MKYRRKRIAVPMKAEKHLIGSLITPLTVTRTFLGPARSLCSQSHTPWGILGMGRVVTCQVPRVTRPSQMGRVRLEPRRQAWWRIRSIRDIKDHHLGMSGHVVGALTGVLEGNLLGHEPEKEFSCKCCGE